MSEGKGKAKEVVGWVTGDREVEAEGRAEQEAADPDKPVDDVTEGAVEEKEAEVRQEHDEYKPGER